MLNSSERCRKVSQSVACRGRHRVTNAKSPLIAIALWVGAFAAAARSEAPPTGDPRMGVCAHFSQGWDTEKLMPLIQRSGLGWIRDDLGWEGAETERGKYQIPERTLAWIDAAHAHHLRLLLILNGGNKLYDDRYDVEAFAKWAAWCATALKGKVDALEILNEPNNFGFSKFYGGGHEGEGDSPWVERYVKLMNRAAEAIKKADPAMPVIGLGAGPIVTYRQLKLGVSPQVDGVVDHPYSNHSVPELMPYNAEQIKTQFGITICDQRGTFSSLIDGFTKTSAENHGPKQIWLTEWGFSTFEPLGPAQFSGFTESAQAKYVLRRFAQCLGQGIEASFLYEFRDGGNAHDAEDRFGLVRDDGTPKPAYRAVQNLTAAFRGLKMAPGGAKNSVTVFPAACWAKQEPVLTYSFVDEANQPSLAIWATDPADSDLQPRVTDVELEWGTGVKQIALVDTFTGSTRNIEFKDAHGRLLIAAMVLHDYPVILKASGTATAVSAGLARKDLRLFEHGVSWNFSNGQEFPGAAGSFALVETDKKPTGLLHYDFSKGGAYVSAQTDVNIPDSADELRFSVQANQPLRVVTMINDSKGQTLKYVSAVSGGGAWETIRISLGKKPHEHWGGTNDGVAHFPLTKLAIAVEAPQGARAGDAQLADAVLLEKL